MDTSVQPTIGVSADSLDGAIWHKSSYSGTHGNCVEVARNLPGMVAVRDSKNPDVPKLLVSPADWQAFVRSLKTGAIG